MTAIHSRPTHSPQRSARACWLCGKGGRALAPSTGAGQGWARTHPKCCTTLGSMAASCSMEGNWYLQAEQDVRPSAAGGTGLEKAGGWVAPGTYP